MLEGLTLRAAGAFLRRAWPFLLIAGLTIALGITRHTLAGAREDLTREASFRTEMKDILHAPNANHDGLRAKARAVVAESLDRLQTLERISREAEQAGQRSRTADAALQQEQEANARRFAAAQRRIQDLENRRPSGNAAQDLHAIEEDSEAAWRGWR